MKALILAAAYPIPNGARPMYFVHSRNLYYQKNGIDVTVINFSAKKSYTFDGIRVISIKEYKTLNEKFDVLILHAANLRNHYVFLKKYGNRFDKKIFVFHGHEVLHINKYYPRSYGYLKSENRVKDFLQNRYDDFKLTVWHKYYSENIDNIRLLFVSKWLMQQFETEVGLCNENLRGHTDVISNSVGEFFEKNEYSPQNIVYDFLTIRSNMDDSKYAVDIVVNMAENHSNYRFCIIGKGDYFKYNKQPSNVEWICSEMSHEDLMGYINQSRYALMPTREDTQGLMACEMATTGMPLITSNIDVCEEVFSDCPRVAFIDNESPDLNDAIEKLKQQSSDERWLKYTSRQTIMKEMAFIRDYSGIMK
jgi:hypothetical protein